MKLTKGKISKLYSKKKQSFKKRKGKPHKKGLTFRKKKRMNLARKTLKKMKGGSGEQDNLAAEIKATEELLKSIPSSTQPGEPDTTQQPGQPVTDTSQQPVTDTTQNPGETVEPVKPGETVTTQQSGETVEPVKPVEPGETVTDTTQQPGETVEPVKPGETVEPVKPVEPGETGETDTTQQPGEPGETDTTQQPGETDTTQQPVEPEKMPVTKIELENELTKFKENLLSELKEKIKKAYNAFNGTTDDSEAQDPAKIITEVVPKF
jgi:hypothetical protein